LRADTAALGAAALDLVAPAAGFVAGADFALLREPLAGAFAPAGFAAVPAFEVAVLVVPAVVDFDLLNSVLLR
jgi:hypothetical protein